MQNTVQRITLQTILRDYSRGVLNGNYDRDIEPKRVRFYISRLLNLASNYGWADYPYPIPAESRESICRRLNEFAWEARALLTNAEATDYDTALARVNQIIRNV